MAIDIASPGASADALMTALQSAGFPTGSADANARKYYGLSKGTNDSPVLLSPQLGHVEGNDVRFVSEAISLSRETSSSLLWLQGGGTNIVLRMPYIFGHYIGKRYTVYISARNGSETALLKDGDETMAMIKDADGGAVTSVTFNATGQYVVLEAWDDTQWRIIRATAVVV